MLGNEDADFRRLITDYVNRKNGVGDIAHGRAVTRAQAWFLQHDPLFDSVPIVPGPKVQNEDGSFRYLPGMDGPIGS